MATLSGVGLSLFTPVGPGLAGWVVGVSSSGPVAGGAFSAV